MQKNGAKLITSYPGFFPSGTRFPPGEINILRPGNPSFSNSDIGEPPIYPGGLLEDHIKILSARSR